MTALTENGRARYSRHILLAGIGEQGQQRLLDSRVLIVGLGGLGSPVAMYLAASGVGQLALCDYDHVELSNLQRQIVHGTGDVGDDKVVSAARAIARLNPEVEVHPLSYALDAQELAEQVRAADVVVDCTDNFETRFELNAACWHAGRPLVSAAAVRMEGQVAVFDPRAGTGPCYRCLYSEEDGPEGEPCARVGVLAPLLGIVGSIEATETLKLLLDLGESLAGRVVVVDAFDLSIHTLKLRPDPACPVCGTGA